MDMQPMAVGGKSVRTFFLFPGALCARDPLFVFPFDGGIAGISLSVVISS